MRTGYYLELFAPETMKLLLSTKSKITNNENGEMCLIWKVLMHCNVNNSYQQNLRVLINLLVNYLDISPKNFIFLKTFDSEFSYREV